MSDSILTFKIIACESSPRYTPCYLYAGKAEGSEWRNNETWFNSLDDVGRRIAKEIVGTKSNYLIISEPLENKHGAGPEGVVGYSESPEVMFIRRLTEHESRSLGIIIAEEIRTYKTRKKERLSFLH